MVWNQQQIREWNKGSRPLVQQKQAGLGGRAFAFGVLLERPGQA
jgi:hypothetical protein